jgi:hypothetical protein
MVMLLLLLLDITGRGSCARRFASKASAAASRLLPALWRCCAKNASA